MGDGVCLERGETRVPQIFWETKPLNGAVRRFRAELPDGSLHMEEVATPSVAADDEAARLTVMRLLAELQEIDEHSARLNGLLETAPVPASVAEPTPNPAASATTARQPRQSSLSADESARLAALLSEEGGEERKARDAIRRAQTSTLRMLSGSATSAMPSADELPQLAAEMLAQAQEDFAPDTSAMAQMEKELRVLTIKRDVKAQEIELRKLTAELEQLQSRH